MYFRRDLSYDTDWISKNDKKIILKTSQNKKIHTTKSYLQLNL